jgi:monofunctional biosynthetic peptidoglycan transglycosylase
MSATQDSSSKPTLRLRLQIVRNRLLRSSLLPIFAFFGVVACFTAVGLFAWIEYTIPNVDPVKVYYPNVRPDPSRDKGFRIVWSKRQPQKWVELDDVSSYAVAAVLLSEDWAFYQHRGYDLQQIQQVFGRFLDSGELRRGASTITQQVAKNLFLSPRRTIFRKLRELVLAIRLERNLTKSRILEIYLNIAQWGKGIYGISSAAEHYFAKSPEELTPREGAFLAMLLPSPVRYGASFRRKKLSDFAEEVVDTILYKMKVAQYLDEEEFETQKLTRLSFESIPEAGLNPTADPDFSIKGEFANTPQDSTGVKDLGRGLPGLNSGEMPKTDPAIGGNAVVESPRMDRETGAGSKVPTSAGIKIPANPEAGAGNEAPAATAKTRLPIAKEAPETNGESAISDAANNGTTDKTIDDQSENGQEAALSEALKPSAPVSDDVPKVDPAELPSETIDEVATLENGDEDLAEPESGDEPEDEADQETDEATGSDPSP